MMKIWQRVFILELLETFFLFIAVFWGLYVLIDYSSRAAHHWISLFSFKELATYYSFLFVERLDIIIPFALVVAAVKTYTSMNVRNELVALMGSGVPLKRLLRPFLFTALFITGLILLSNELLLPYTNRATRLLKSTYLKEPERALHDHNLHVIRIIGGGEAIYHHFDLTDGSFFDLYWIKNVNEVWRMRKLYPTEMPPRAIFADQFVRNERGEMLLEESQKEVRFPGMEFEPMDLKRARIEPKEESITSLFKQLNNNNEIRDELKSEMQATLLHKLIMPFLALFAVLAPAPYCLRFTRDLPIFMLFFMAIVILVTFYLVMNAALILGESGALNPLYALTLPPLLYGSFFLYKYAEMK